jgi:hypothetical protein
VGIFDRILKNADDTPELVAEHIVGSQSRMTGAALGCVRRALKMTPVELGAAIHAQPYQITLLEEDREAMIPEQLDLDLRRLFLSR